MKKSILFMLFYVYLVLISSTLIYSQTNEPGFIQNTGKWNSAVKFLARMNGLNFWINKDGFTIDNYITSKQEKTPESLFDAHNTENIQIERKTGQIIKMSFLNVKNNFKTIAPENPILKIYSFIGKDRNKWQSVNSYSKLKVNNLYKDIDAIITIEDNQPRYDFIVNPGANPESIKFNFKGQDQIELSNNGDKIELTTRFGKLSTGKLYAYQDLDGKRKQIKCQFVWRSNFISFKLGDYDSKYKLTIDPKIYATYLGGSGDEEITSSVIDKDNNLIVTGWTNSSDFPSSTGAYDTTYFSEKDVFVTKIQLTGNERKILFSTYLGGTNDEIPNAVGVDNNGDIYIAGETNSANFPAHSGIGSQINGLKDGFITKLSSDGSKIIYSSFLGGTNDDYILAMGVGESGAVYVTGGTSSPAFPSSVVYNLGGDKGREEAFITKISPSGTTIVYSAIMTTTGLDRGTAIAVDEAQSTVIVCGITDNARFYTIPNSGGNRVWDRYYNGGWDGFIAKIGTSGAFCEFAGFYGGGNDDYINSVILDKDGSFYLAGKTNSSISAINPTSVETDFPLTDGSINKKFNGVWDCFIAKFDKRCNSLLFSTYYGGNNDDSFMSLASHTGRTSIFAVGYSASSNFPILNDPTNPKYHGGKDIVLCEFSPQGTEVSMSTLIGGTLDDVGKSVSIDNYGDIYIAGYSMSKNFPANKGAIQDTIKGSKDAFVYKYTFKELSLTNPIKGDEYCAGSPMNIIWTANNFSEVQPKFILDYSSDGGTTWHSIAKDITASIYEWKIPQKIQPGSDYLVRVYHQSGIMSYSSGTFSIVSAPSISSISKTPDNLSLCEGDPIRFSVSASGKDIKFAWRKNGVNIPNANDSVLSLSSIALSDIGKYDVRISGKCSPDTISGSFTITATPKTTILTASGDLTIKAGKTAHFSVSAAGANLTYEWHWNKIKITDATDSIFTIPNCTKNNEGRYMCIVKGTCGSDTSNEATLTVDTVNSVSFSTDTQKDNLQIELISSANNTIKLRLSAENDCNSFIYLTDNSGRFIRDIFSGLVNTAKNDVIFDCNDYAQGVYWIVAECGTSRTIKKCSIIK